MNKPQPHQRFRLSHSYRSHPSPLHVPEAGSGHVGIWWVRYPHVCKRTGETFRIYVRCYTERAAWREVALLARNGIEASVEGDA